MTFTSESLTATLLDPRSRVIPWRIERDRVVVRIRDRDGLRVVVEQDLVAGLGDDGLDGRGGVRRQLPRRASSSRPRSDTTRRRLRTRSRRRTRPPAGRPCRRRCRRTGRTARTSRSSGPASTPGTLALIRRVVASTSVTVPRYLPKNRLRSRSSTSIIACSFITPPPLGRPAPRAAGSPARRGADGVADQDELHLVSVGGDRVPHAPDQIRARVQRPDAVDADDRPGAEDDAEPGDIGLTLAAHEPTRLAQQRARPQRQLAAIVHRGARRRRSSACR